MCEYSLTGVPNRLANEGEDLVVRCFCTGTKGLAPCHTSDAKASNWSGRVWVGMKDFFRLLLNKEEAVCIPPGAQLLVADIPKKLQRRFNARPVEWVTFTQLTASDSVHRDAIRLWNGTEISLQRLHEGQRFRVLRLSVPEPGQARTMMVAGAR